MEGGKMPMIIKISFRNIFRNKRRTILTLSTISFTILSIIVFLSWMKGIMDNWIDNTVRFAYGHVKIANEEYIKKEKILPLEYSVNNLAAVLKEIKKDKEVVTVRPVIKFGAQLEFKGNTSDCLGMAVDTVMEKRSSRIQNSIIQGNYWGDDQTGTGQGILIGIKTAKELGVKLNDEVTVLARTADFSPYLLVYKVRGIFSTGMISLDKGLFYINLADASELLNMYNSANEILIMLDNKDKSFAYAAKISKRLHDAGLDKNLKIMPWQEQGGLGKMIRVSYVMFGLFILIIAIVAGLTILNTMMMSVFERTHEIGMIRALGMKRIKILTMIISESVVIGVIGGLIGGISGSAVAYFFFEKVGIDYTSVMDTAQGWYMDPVMRGDFRISQFFIGFLAGVVLTIVAGIYPAYRASKMRPVKALRII
jgi:putative ABC transport system permease protein